MNTKDNNATMKLENQLCFPLYAAARSVTGLYTPWLKQLGLTQTELAVLLDVSKNAVNDWENDKYEPNDTHWKIITALQDLQIDKDEETQLAFLRNKKLCPDCQKRMEEYIHRFYEILRKNMDSHDEK